MVIKNPSDFIGSVIGGSEAQTKAILASTVGKVLIIDEVSTSLEMVYPDNMTTRRTCCMEVVAVTRAVINIRLQSSTRSLQRYRAFRARIDVCFCWDTEIRWKRCFRFLQLELLLSLFTHSFSPECQPRFVPSLRDRRRLRL